MLSETQLAKATVVSPQQPRTVFGDDRVYVKNDNCDIADRQSVCE
jgi:hypothetical protein